MFLRLNVLIFAISIVFTVLPGAATQNLDTPKKGEWDLKQKEIWSLTKANNSLFTKPDIVVSEDGTCYIHDIKNKLTYIFDGAGKYIKSFGKKGEGPGEIRFHDLSYFVDDMFVAFDMGSLHFFSKLGKFKKKILNAVGFTVPQFFLNKNEFVSTNMRGKGMLTHKNIETGKKKILKEYFIKRLTLADNSTRFLPGISPSMIVGYDYKNQKIYYGINDTYLIHCADLNGKILHSFSVDRKKKKISTSTRDKELKILFGSDFNKELFKSIPNELVYFNRIQIINEHVYVFVGNFSSNWESQKIDIFSLNGEYLYSSLFKPEKGFDIYLSYFNNIVLKKEHLYVVLEKDDSEVIIRKYKISLPNK